MFFKHENSATNSHCISTKKKHWKNINLQYLSTLSKKKHDLPLPHRFKQTNFVTFVTVTANCRCPVIPIASRTIVFAAIYGLPAHGVVSTMFSICHPANQIPKWPPLFGYSTRNFNCPSQFSNFFTTHQRVFFFVLRVANCLKFILSTNLLFFCP